MPYALEYSDRGDHPDHADRVGDGIPYHRVCQQLVTCVGGCDNPDLLQHGSQCWRVVRLPANKPAARVGRSPKAYCTPTTASAAMISIPTISRLSRNPFRRNEAKNPAPLLTSQCTSHKKCAARSCGGAQKASSKSASITCRLSILDKRIPSGALLMERPVAARRTGESTCQKNHQAGKERSWRSL